MVNSFLESQDTSDNLFETGSHFVDQAQSNLRPSFSLLSTTITGMVHHFQPPNEKYLMAIGLEYTGVKESRYFYMPFQAFL